MTRQLTASYIGFGLSVLMGLSLAPFYYSSIGSEEYGVYALISSALAFLLLADFGFSLRLQRVLVNIHARRVKKIALLKNRIARARNSAFSAIFAVLIFSASVVSVFQISFVSLVDVSILAMLAPVCYLRVIVRTFAKGFGDFDKAAWGLILGELCRHVFCLFSIYLGNGNHIYLLVGLLISAIIECVAVILMMQQSNDSEFWSYIAPLDKKKNIQWRPTNFTGCWNNYIGFIQVIGAAKQFVINSCLAYFYGSSALGSFHLLNQYFNGLISLISPLNAVVYTSFSNLRMRIKKHPSRIFLMVGLTHSPWILFLVLNNLPDYVCRIFTMCTLPSDSNLLAGLATLSSFSIFYVFLYTISMARRGERGILFLTLGAVVAQILTFMFDLELSTLIVTWGLISAGTSAILAMTYRKIARLWLILVWMWLVGINIMFNIYG